MIARIWHGWTSPDNARKFLSGFDAEAQHYEIIDETIY